MSSSGVLVTIGGVAGTPIKGTVGNGTTLTSSIPVLVGGVTAAGVVKVLKVNTNGTAAVS